MHNMDKIKENFTKDEVIKFSQLGNVNASMSFIENISENVWRVNEYATKIDGLYRNITVYFNDKLKYIGFVGNQRLQKSDDLLALVAQKVIRGVDLISKKNIYGDTPMYSCSVVDYRKKVWKDFVYMKRDDRDDDAIEELRGGGFKIPTVEIIDISFTPILTNIETVNYINDKRILRKKSCAMLLDIDGKEDLPLRLEVTEEIGTLPHRIAMNKISVYKDAVELVSCTEMDIERFIKIIPKLIQNIL